MDSNTTLFEIAKPITDEADHTPSEDNNTDVNSGRFVRYQFTPQVDSHMRIPDQKTNSYSFTGFAKMAFPC